MKWPVPQLEMRQLWDTAQILPDAKLLVIEGMGHDLPQGAWRKIFTAISTHLQHD
jgi:uncharacterized protein YjeT (DUF2065 family)